MGIGGGIEGDGLLVQPDGVGEFLGHLMFHRRFNQFQGALLLFRDCHGCLPKIVEALSCWISLCLGIFSTYATSPRLGFLICPMRR